MVFRLLYSLSTPIYRHLLLLLLLLLQDSNSVRPYLLLSFLLLLF